jgi:hypothetical protein
LCQEIFTGTLLARDNLCSFGAVMKKTAFALIVICALLIPSMANAQITSSYSNNTNINPVAFTLSIYSPETNQTYMNTIPLNFTVDWTEYPTFTFPSPPAPILQAIYSYTIDNNSAVFLTLNQSSSDIFGYSNFTVNPTFSYLLNVSNLAKGYHKIVITADLHDNYGEQYFNESSDPVFFSIQNPTPTPTALPTLNIEVITVASVIIGVVVIAGLVYFKKRKH